MTDERLVAAEQAFTDHEHFEAVGDGEYTATNTPFESEVRVETDEGAVVYRVVSRVPTLDSVVEGETVADVVEEGWYETLERRVGDIHGVTSAETSDPDIRQEGETVVVETTLRDANPDRVPQEAQALIDYVFGTWMEGVIPGYEYTEEVQAIRDRAAQNYDERNRGADLTL